MKNVIYQIKNKINDKSYIGSSCRFTERKNTHLASLRKNKHDNRLLQNSWNKYGEQNFEFIILKEFENISRDELYLIENEYVQKLKTTDRNYGYNIANPANKPPNMKGKKLSEKHREKISISNKGKLKGRKLSEETKLKIGIHSKNRIRTKEWCEKISLSRIGEKNPNWKGKHSWNKGMKNKYTLSEEHKRKISEGNKGRIQSDSCKEKLRISHQGSKAAQSKLTEEDVVFIKKYFKENKKYKPLIEKFNVTISTLCDIKKERTWKHIKI